MDHRTEILDLRTALEVLRGAPGQLVETSVEVDPAAERSGVYRYVGAGGTVMRPTVVDGPAMIFHNVKGHPGASVAIGVDPAIEVLSCFEPPTTLLGLNELSIAGALRQRPVELVKCVSVNEHAIANAEFVIEGEILPGSNHVVEDQNSHTGFAMPEFPGCNYEASRLGAVILPPMLAYYNGPRSLEDCTRHTVDRILSQFDLDEGSFQWEGMEE